MGSMRSAIYALIYLCIITTTNVYCYQYKVGDLNAWGEPTSANPKVYSNWAQKHIFKLGDSLLFLYPPSSDSLIQVTEESYNSCNLKDPILYMNNGNSLFNFTKPGHFYFTSGEKGHCEKHQKLQISIAADGFSPSYGPTSSSSDLPDTAAPSYSNAFGSIPMAPSSTPSSSSMLKAPALIFTAVIGLVISQFMAF